MELGVDYPEEDVCKGLEILKDKWPGLTGEEKREIACVIDAYKRITILEDEDDDDLEDTHSIDNKKQFIYKNW